SNRNLARHFSAASEFTSLLFGVIGVVVSLLVPLELSFLAS
ncbi:27882_t:CDS:1, partial [Racocetra persica]